MRRLSLTFVAALLLGSPNPQAQPSPTHAAHPLRLAVAGLVHGHVHGFLRAVGQRDDITLVGVYEPDASLRARVLARDALPADLAFDDLDRMLATARPEAVAIFTSTADHPRVVQAVATRRVHVMMEKPLAVSVADGERIRETAESSGIHVIVNYETTWYPSLGTAWRILKDEHAAGGIRKMVAMDGHEGPKEIGVEPEFLAWLTDPVKNGAGALYDFGCYGANLMTWLMDDARPRSVRALTQQFKKSIYPRVDDEATILLEYERAQGIVQASWNWPTGRKDLEIYAERGYAIATGGGDLRLRFGADPEQKPAIDPLPPDRRDSLSYLMAVVRGRFAPDGPPSLRNNLIVTEILAAARESARTGRAVALARRSPVRSNSH